MLIKIPNDAEKILYWVDEINYDVLFLIYFERFENANNRKREYREIERRRMGDIMNYPRVI